MWRFHPQSPRCSSSASVRRPLGLCAAAGAARFQPRQERRAGSCAMGGCGRAESWIPWANRSNDAVLLMAKTTSPESPNLRSKIVRRLRLHLPAANRQISQITVAAAQTVSPATIPVPESARFATFDPAMTLTAMMSATSGQATVRRRGRRSDARAWRRRPANCASSVGCIASYSKPRTRNRRAPGTFS